MVMQRREKLNQSATVPVEPRLSVASVPNMPPPGRPSGELVASNLAQLDTDKRNEEREERQRKEREEQERIRKEREEKKERDEREKREREERERKEREERERRERREREERERKMKKEKEEREERERLQEEKKTKENIPINLARLPMLTPSSTSTTTTTTTKPSSVDKTYATIAAAQATTAAALAVVAASSPTPASKKLIIDAYNVLTPSYTLDELRKFDMKGVDRSQREAYLTQADFQAAFGMTRDQFYALPKWKRQDSKAKLGIF